MPNRMPKNFLTLLRSVKNVTKSYDYMDHVLALADLKCPRDGLQNDLQETFCVIKKFTLTAVLTIPELTVTLR